MTDEKWESVNELGNVITFDEEGQATEGKFLRSFEHTTKSGISYTVYEIENPAKEKEQIFGAGNLNYLMGNVNEGDYIRIKFIGIQKGEGCGSAGHSRL